MDIIQELYNLGANNVAEIPVSKVDFEPELRKMCEDNACGRYGKNYACPPYVQEPEKLIEEAKNYDKAIVFQTITEIEDSYDFEGMTEAGDAHNEITMKIGNLCSKNLEKDYLNIGNGICRVCESCAALTGESCRVPERKTLSLEVYCVYVAKLAKACGMNYINGENTVTYFGMLLVKD